MTDFQHGLCGCCDDCTICLLTYFVPCYTVGKTAEKLDQSCCLCGFLTLVPAVSCFAMCILRGNVREANGIDGNAFTDFLSTICCPFCVMTQMAQEVDALK
ncbi:uncharacterized protein LOC135823530 [Sycon ciliatum]|uniref:uncharacterized protein LOC135823530 n=1 Tax=Sycon ciliatum TaxID=27933 RepID=UPI0020AD7052|eukprot:scpid94647/ scgid21196/ Protein PLANT CADMIUM RESISTANCE 2